MAAEEKTEQATPKRRRDERKKGNAFKSQEVITVASLLGVFFVLQTFASLILTVLSGGIERFWTQASTMSTIGVSDVRKLFMQSASIYAIAAMPALLTAGLVAIVLTFAQTKGLVAAASFKPKFNRLNPAQGIKRVFSIRGLVQLLKSILKIVILAYVIYNQYMARFEELPRLMEMEFISVLFYGGQFLMDVVVNAAIIFAFLAGADYLYQRWQFEKDLRMSKQELKEEYKQTEGDPQIKGKIKERQRQMAQSRMMSNVPNADVVIKNPTHYAVAIKYDAEKNHAPVVLAKGADLIALRIIRTAEENDIPTVENRPLARGLYENVPLDREVPEEYFQPVAEVLAFVYSLNEKKMQKVLRKGKRRQ